MSKVKISKAIHNAAIQQALGPWAVVNMSKVKISKAIHNRPCAQKPRAIAVVNMSKVKISKAIHNAQRLQRFEGVAVLFATSFSLFFRKVISLPILFRDSFSGVLF